MLPVGPGAWLAVVCFPLLVVGALVYPAYAIWRFRYRGSPAALQHRQRSFVRVVLVGGGALYVVLAVALFLPDVAPALARLVEKGYLALAVPIMIVDGVLAAALTPRR
jgi:hypothetical protein